jgi:hypothetical protein
MKTENACVRRTSRGAWRLEAGGNVSSGFMRADVLRLVFQTQPRSGKNQIPKGFQGTMTEFHVSHLPAK